MVLGTLSKLEDPSLLLLTLLKWGGPERITTLGSHHQDVGELLKMIKEFLKGMTSKGAVPPPIISMTAQTLYCSNPGFPSKAHHRGYTWNPCYTGNLQGQKTHKTLVLYQAFCERTVTSNNEILNYLSKSRWEGIQKQRAFEESPPQQWFGHHYRTPLATDICQHLPFGFDVFKITLISSGTSKYAA